MGRLKSYWIELFLVATLMAAVGFFGYLAYGLVVAQAIEEEGYSGEDALEDVVAQVAFGPRIVGTEASAEAQEWLAREVQKADWYPIYQPFYLPVPADAMPEGTNLDDSVGAEQIVVEARNIIAASTLVTDTGMPLGWLIAPYDTRLWADADPDPDQQQASVLGANGGASGPAALLELARTLNKDLTGHRFCILLLDGEANRGLPGWNDLTGVDYLLRGVSSVEQCADPAFAVVLDLVGGDNQQIYIDRNSDPALSAAIWNVASELGYGDAIIAEPKWDIVGIQSTLNANGIPTAALIDNDYAYKATTDDTIEKLSADSFTRIGRTLVAWLEAGAPYAGK